MEGHDDLQGAELDRHLLWLAERQLEGRQSSLPAGRRGELRLLHALRLQPDPVGLLHHHQLLLHALRFQLLNILSSHTTFSFPSVAPAPSWHRKVGFLFRSPWNESSTSMNYTTHPMRMSTGFSEKSLREGNRGAEAPRRTCWRGLSLPRRERGAPGEVARCDRPERTRWRCAPGRRSRRPPRPGASNPPGGRREGSHEWHGDGFPAALPAGQSRGAAGGTHDLLSSSHPFLDKVWNFGSILHPVEDSRTLPERLRPPRCLFLTGQRMTPCPLVSPGTNGHTQAQGTFF